MPETNNKLQSITKYFVIAAVVMVLLGWLINTPSGFLGKADAIGYAVCHRIPERSFHIGDYQLPLCARCSGMYLGAVLGLVIQSVTGWKRGKTPHWGIIAILAVFFLAFGVDGANSYLYLIKSIRPGFLEQIPNLYTPNNVLRVFTGSGMGLAMAVMVFPAFNQSIWTDYDEKKPAIGWKWFGISVALTVLLDLLVLTESPIVLYPAAILSALGVWLLLTLVYTIVWVLIMKQDNTFTRLRDLWVPLLAGLTIAILQTAAIDAVRFIFTGTWGAFPLG